MAKFFGLAPILVTANAVIRNSPDISQYDQHNLNSFTVADVQPVLVENNLSEFDATDENEVVQKACSNKCWELADDGVTCVPAADKVKTICGGNTMTMVIDECVLDNHDLQGMDFKPFKPRRHP